MTERNLKVLFWDLDDTLIDLYRSIDFSLQKCFNTLNINFYNENVFKYYCDLNLKYWSMLEKSEISIEEVFIKRFDDLFSKYNISANSKSASDIYEKYTYEKVFVYNDIINIVKKCQGKYKQYVTTNGNHTIQRGKLITASIINLFDAIFISSDIGFLKPQKEYFDKVLDFIGEYKKDEIMIIGDSQTSDMLGANNSNIKCCYLNRYDKKIDNNLKIDFNIKTSKELEIILFGA